MVNGYDLRKTEVAELKKRVVDYFKSRNCFDNTLSSLLGGLNLGIDDLDLLEFCLNELVEEGWIQKSSSFDHNEFDPGEKMNYGGLRE